MNRSKRMIALLLSVVLVLSMLMPLTSVFATEMSNVAISNLKTNDTRNPVGVDITTPTFSWQMQSSIIGQKQTAYQIVVATDSALKEVVWDSNKQDDERSIGIPYGGAALEQMTTYYWQVSVWDKNGAAVVSDTAQFEMGLLGPDAWSDTEWIKMGTSNELPDGEKTLNYTLEADFQIVSAAVAIVFEATDASNYLMWQFSDNNGLHFRPHTKKSGGYANITDVDVTAFAKGTSKDVQHIKIEVTNNGVKTYLNDTLISTLPADQLNGVGFTGKIGLIGFRSSDLGADERGYFDNMVLTDYASNTGGKVVSSYDFETKNPFTAGTLQDGRLYTETNGDVTGLQSGDGPVNTNANYVVEADLTCANHAVSILFNALDNGNFYMWQLNTKDTPGKVLLKPHTWKDGAFATYNKSHTIDVTSVVTPEDLKTTPVHMRLEVNGSEIKTYLNDTLVDTFAVGQISDQGTTGLPINPGLLGFRADLEEKGTVDNFSMTDYTNNAGGEVVYNYTFENGSNPFLAGTIENNAFVSYKVGILLPPLGTPTFRKEFKATDDIVSAKLYTTGLGVFDAYINGERVGTRQGDGSMIYDELKPGYTHPAKHVFYYTYDVTQMLKSNSVNTMTANVTNGWYGGAISGHYGSAAYRAKLILTYQDGSQQIVGTDSSWKTALAGPIISGDLYQGETYNANADVSFRENGYNDSSWNYAEKDTQFKGDITSLIGPPVRIREDLKLDMQWAAVYDGSTDVTDTQFGKTNTIGTYKSGESFTLEPGQKAVFDMGQNFAGWDQIEVQGAKDTIVTMRHSEMLNDNNGIKSRGNDGPEGSIYTANLRSAAAKGTYVMSGKGIETYNSTHTFYGFRYVEMSTTAPITVHGMKGIVVTSVEDNTGSLTTSNKDVNQLISNILWGQYSNYLSIPTDCPQRDERQGWTADTQVFSTAAAYNADSKGFLTKYMQDMRDSQLPDGSYADTAPYTGYGETGQLGWADAGVIIPYNIYKMYGDKSIIEENYAAMQKFMDVFMASTNKNGGGHNHGDWLAYEDNGDEINYLFGIAYYAWDAQMMAEMAEVLGKTEDVAKYQEIYEIEKEYFQERFVNADGTLKRTEQTACLMALKMDLLPNEESKELVKQALLDNIKRNGNKLQTGFLGTAIIMQTLSDIGASDVAYQLLLQRDNPSWMYSIDQGATTIWERWNSYTKESGFGPVSMNSFNHYSYGAVAEWMYGYMAGIDYNFSDPGFKHITLQPTPDQLIKNVDCSYESPYGMIESNWKYENGNLLYNAVVPANTTATVYMPVEEGMAVTVNGKAPEDVTTELDGLQYIETKDGKAVFEAVAGSFSFATSVTKYCYVNLLNADSSIPVNVSINGGDLQALPPMIKAEVGQPITIKASAFNDVDYAFSGWTGDMTSKDAQITVTPTEDMTLTANFKWDGNQNLAQGKPATSNNTMNAPPTWSISNLTDGVLNHLGGNNGYTSNTYNSPDIANNPTWITIDLGEVTDFNSVQIYPRTDTFTSGKTTLNFPTHYQIRISDDNKEFTTVYETDDQKAPLWKPAVINLDQMQSAQYVQINVLHLGDRDVSGRDPNRLQLSELGIYNVNPPQPEKTNKTILEQVIATAEPLLTSEEYLNAIPSVQQSFTKTLTDAKAIYANDYATQEQVDNAWMTLMTEIHKLGFQSGNKEQLLVLLTYARDIDLENYITAGQAEFIAELAKAEAVYADADAMQGEVDGTTIALLDTIKQLRLKANKETLDKVLNQAKAIDQTLYTADSLTAFNDAVAEGERIFSDPNATKEQVDAIVEQINQAQDALIKTEIPTTDETTDSKDITADGANGTTNNTTAPTTGETNIVMAVTAMLLLTGAAVVFNKKKKN